MTSLDWIILIVLFLATSVVGVVTGSNSLVTVPAMFQLGIDEKMAIGTNMFGLTFMAVGGTIPFIRQGRIEPGRLSPLIIVTLAGSALGALMVGYIANDSIKLIVSIGMFVVVGFTLLRPGPRPSESSDEWKGWSGSYWTRPLGLIITFLLAIYGGLYSGGYVTILTAAFVAFLGMSYTESVGSTKLINVFSSAIATLVFMWQGFVDYSLGAVLAVTMFIGAYIGAHYATKMNELWLRRIFLGTVILLAIKTLYDLAAT